jgi:2-polyprenyl-3-methyl-5-hydroxy-6-metoxy-1,4-benzoquinol methylase
MRPQKQSPKMIHPNTDLPEGSTSNYDGYSVWKNWNDFFRFSADDSSYFAKEVPAMSLKGREVLEIGFGEGRFLAWAQARGARVAGMELDSRSLAAADAAGTALVTDIEAHSAAHQDRYALIAAFDVFEHLTLSQIETHLVAIAKLLEPGGVLILRYPNGQSPFGLSPQNGDVTHITALSQAKIDQLAQPLGFVTERYAGSAMPQGRGIVRLRRAVIRGLRRLVGRLLNALFNVEIVWDSVVTQVLRKA